MMLGRSFHAIVMLHCMLKCKHQGKISVVLMNDTVQKFFLFMGYPVSQSVIIIGTRSVGLINFAGQKFSCH